MPEAIQDAEVLAAALMHMRRVVATPEDVDGGWLQVNSLVVLPEICVHLSSDQCGRLSKAFALLSVDSVLAVATEPAQSDQTAYFLNAAADDLEAHARASSGTAYVLVPESGPDLAVLWSRDDYILVAGPREFVQRYAGDLRRARRNFISFVDSCFETAQLPLRHVEHYLSWTYESAGDVPYRDPGASESALLEAMLQKDFPGRSALLAQAAQAQVRRCDVDGSIEFSIGLGPRAEVVTRIAAEIDLEDGQGNMTHVVLYAVEGFLSRLEVYGEGVRPIIPPEEIAALLRESEVLLGRGMSIGDVAGVLGASEMTLYRWRREYGVLRPAEEKRLADLELENARLCLVIAEMRAARGYS